MPFPSLPSPSSFALMYSQQVDGGERSEGGFNSKFSTQSQMQRYWKVKGVGWGRTVCSWHAAALGAVL
jgi:hypothetical protein